LGGKTILKRGKWTTIYRPFISYQRELREAESTVLMRRFPTMIICPDVLVVLEAS